MCGSAADFLLGVAINAGKSDEIESSNKEGAGEEEEGENMLDDNGNTSQCMPNSSTHCLLPPDVALPSQLTNSLPLDVVAPRKCQPH